MNGIKGAGFKLIFGLEVIVAGTLDFNGQERAWNAE